MIDFPLNFWQVNENDFKIATKVLGVIRDLMDEIKEMDGATKKFLSVFGNPEKRFELKKLELVGIINKNLGVIQLELGEEGAIESFERAYENLCQCRNYGNALNYLALKEGAKFCFHWSFGEMIDLKELKKMFGKYGFLCSLETKSAIYAMLAVTETLKGRDVKKFVENVEFPNIRAPLLGVLAVLGKWDKHETIAELKRADEREAELSKIHIDNLVESAIHPDWEKELKGFAEYHNISLKEAREICKLYLDEKPELKDKLLLLRPVSGIHSLIRILRLYLEGDLNKAIETADWRSKISPPLPSKLFSQVAEALRKNDDREFKEAVIKLFFYFV